MHTDTYSMTLAALTKAGVSAGTHCELSVGGGYVWARPVGESCLSQQHLTLRRIGNLEGRSGRAVPLLLLDPIKDLKHRPANSIWSKLYSLRKPASAFKARYVNKGIRHESLKFMTV